MTVSKSMTIQHISENLDELHEGVWRNAQIPGRVSTEHVYCNGYHERRRGMPRSDALRELWLDGWGAADGQGGTP